ncbi:protein ZNF365 isoform X2 [Mastacembelus armatus]|uniref:protein ZNF365 isoform X2 n=1 Tax=Mastacembelus armatus TaxID=205130 RepID=UPI000E4555C2|nr:protein ZNF365-like isoform X2 [Mastacembelus armatus]
MTSCGPSVSVCDMPPSDTDGETFIYNLPLNCGRYRVMQQKLCSRGSGSFLLERNGQACGAITDAVTSCNLPFRCPRCGEQERFRSLASLRAHLEYRHSYRSPDVIGGSFSITGKPPDALTAAIPWHDMSLPTRRGHQSTGRPPHVRSLSDSRDSGYPHSYSSVRRRTQSVGVGTQAEEDDEEEEGTEDEAVGEEDEEEDDGEEKDGSRYEEDIKMSTKKSDAGHDHLNHQHPPFLLPSPLGPSRDLDLDLDLVEQNSYSGLETAAASAAVRRRLASILRAADSTMQRRLAKVSTELAQTDTELLCERAHSQHLAQERQEVAERERSLSRQVDVAVMVIAALREQLNASENELERREREVITIQKFLEAAAQQETCGKVRIQRFIENLLRRIALAERLVEYYQVNGSPPQCNHYKHQQPTENGPRRITKSRSAGGQLSSSGPHDNRPPSSSQFSSRPSFSKVGGERDREREHRERLAQSSRLFCRPEHRDDIWNQQRRRSAGLVMLPHFDS